MKKLTNEEKARMMALPLIDLNEIGIDHSIVSKGIKDVFSACGMPLMDEFTKDSTYYLVFSCKDGDLVYPVNASFDSKFRFITLTILLNEAPNNKQKKIAKLINLLNIESPQSWITIIPGEGGMVKSGMFLTRWFDTQALYVNLKGLLINGNSYFVTAAIAITSNKKPATIIKCFTDHIQELREKGNHVLLSERE